MHWASASAFPTTTATEARGPASALLRLRSRLAAPIDAAALAAFRVIFGSLLLIGVIRFAAKGMIHQAFVVPQVFFPLLPGWGPLPAGGMYLLFVVLGLAAALLTLGWFTRAAAALFCLLFSYAHFADLTNYLNHYYLISLLTGLLAVLPSAQVWSLDAARAAARGTPRASTVASWTLWLLRFQVGCVYLFAGLAKLGSDWLRDGNPLRIWLASCGDVPLLGPLLVLPSTALVMSWAGAAFDLSIPFLLLWRRSRPLAYLAVLGFHLLTVRLFRLGMFPFLMMAASLLFLPPGWARRILRGRGGAVAPADLPQPVAPLAWAPLLALLVYAAIQLGIPLRHHLQAGPVHWTERGFRFSWNVMVIEKTGVAEFNLRELATGRERPVRALDHLTPLQIKMMSTQPDLIRDFARFLARQARQQGRPVAVYADVLVSLNGRPAQRLIDPQVDLAADSLPPGWILPARP